MHTRMREVGGSPNSGASGSSACRRCSTTTDSRDRRDLLTLEKRQWLAGLKLPTAAREQIDISLQVIDAFDL
jgi:hypothetical protein